MAIRLGCGAVIYEMPKTGTTWIRESLTSFGIPWTDDPPLLPACPRHSPWWCYPEATTRICSVRHPVSWYESYYLYHTFREIQPTTAARKSVLFDADKWYSHQLFHFENGECDFTFEQWVDRITSFYPAAYTRLVDTYFGPLGFSAMDFVIRVETLPQDLRRVLSKLGYVLNGPHIPAVNRKEGRIQWLIHQRNRVLQLEQDVIRRFYA